MIRTDSRAFVFKMSGTRPHPLAPQAPRPPPPYRRLAQGTPRVRILLSTLEFSRTQKAHTRIGCNSDYNNPRYLFRPCKSNAGAVAGTFPLPQPVRFLS